MAIQVNDIITEFNTIIGDSSNDRVTAAERLSYITKGTVWFKQETSNDHSVNTFDIDYIDGVHYYKISNVVPDIIESNDLRLPIGENRQPFTPKSSREIVNDVAQGSLENAFAIERRDGDTYIVINYDTEYPSMTISSFDSLTGDGGTWQADTTNSDATNLSISSADYTEGGSALVFDIDVSQSVNNVATIFNDDFNPGDLSEDKDISSFLLDVSLPTVSNITSVTFYWGSDNSNYYSVTQTTDINGNAFVTGFQTLQFEWLGATVVGTPDDSNITFFRIDISYSVGQTDATSFRLDNLKIARPKKLKFYYTTSNVGKNSVGADVIRYGATTDVPYYSGQYDHYMYPIAEYSGYLCLKDLRLFNEADRHKLEALTLTEQIKKMVPSSVVKERRQFKVQGISFNRGGRRRYRLK